MKSLTAVAAACMAAATVSAQMMALQSDTRPAQPPDEPVLIRMTVTPQDAPEPALKYRLLPSLADRTPGNAVLMYYLAQQYVNAQDKGALRERVESLLETPLVDLPHREVRDLLERNAQVLRHVELGSLRENADWGFAVEEGARMSLPPLSDFRLMAKLLALRARVEISQGLFDQAIHTISIGMAFGRHVGNGGPTLINGLVGIAIESLMLERVQELIDQGGPNLYWALAELPAPLVGLRHCLEYEQQWLLMSHPELRDASDGPVSPAEGASMLQAVAEMLSLTSSDEGLLGGGKYAQTALALRFYAMGKRALLAEGRNREEVEAMPVGQVVTSYLMSDYLRWRDETFKWLGLPYWQAAEGQKAAERASVEWRHTNGALNPLLSLLPSLGRARLIQAKGERKRAVLQTIEAIRMYAASHDELPVSLADLTVPAPKDPVTGQMFEYQRQEGSFSLVGPSPDGESAREGVRYEVEMAALAQQEAQAEQEVAHEPRGPETADQWRGIGNFLLDETVAVVQVDLGALVSDAGWKQVLGVFEEAGLLDDARSLLAKVHESLRGIVEAGGSEMFVVVSITDLPEQPMILVPMTDQVEPDKLVAALGGGEGRVSAYRLEGALVISTERQRQLLLKGTRTRRPGLLEALNANKGIVCMALGLSDDVRRALRETLVSLPPELGGLSGKELSDASREASFVFSLMPEPVLRLTIQSTSPASATRASSLIEEGMEALAAQIAKSDPRNAELFRSLMAQLRPVSRGNQVVLRMGPSELVSFLRGLAVPVRKSRGLAKRAISAANINGMLMACHVWANAHEGMFPPDLDTLAKEKLITPAMLGNPSRPDLKPVGYVYLRPNAPIKDLPPERIVIYEAFEEFGDGVNVGFVDGHVALINDKAEFDRLLKASKSE